MTNSLNQTQYYLNRELSALAFNRHVLLQATNKSVPLLERLRFLFICGANLDEFFEIRVAGIKEKIALDIQTKSIDGLTPKETLDHISKQAHALVYQLYRIYNHDLLPALEKEHIYIIKPNPRGLKLKNYCENYFINQILPVLSPIALDLAHPFPTLINKSLNFIVSLEGKDEFGRQSRLAIIHAPRSIPRVFKLPDEISARGESYIFLTELIKSYTERVFPGMKIIGCYQFRLTRNSDLFLDEEEIDDLAKAIKHELRQRNFGNVVRLEIDNNCPKEIVDYLLKENKLNIDDVYFCEGPVNINRYIEIFNLSPQNNLKYPPFIPNIPPSLQKQQNIFQLLRQQDILLHHPYQSFDCVINFIHQATRCPKVLAIKQTLYRTHAESRMVQALADAARAGKEVTAIIELRARFDEESNIALAKKLERAGVLVLYGILGFKIHAKMSLIVRKENNNLSRYVHLGTGNYHERTAEIYVDIGILTSNEKIGLDVQKLFHQLTGIGKKQIYNQLIVSPFNLAKTVIRLIDNEIKIAQSGKKANIIFKLNGITDKTIIQALYRASQAGVKISLIVRTLCCLVPNVPGISENISVISVIDRFLEHSRILYFRNNGDEKVFCSSADMMERNLYYRVELCFPISSKSLIERIKQEALFNFLDPNQQRWQLDSKGTYTLKGKTSTQGALIKKYTL